MNTFFNIITDYEFTYILFHTSYCQYENHLTKVGVMHETGCVYSI